MSPFILIPLILLGCFTVAGLITGIFLHNPFCKDRIERGLWFGNTLILTGLLLSVASAFLT